MPRKIYVDSIEVTELINSKSIYTWLKCKDNQIRIISTREYDNCTQQIPYFLCSINKKTSSH